VRPVRPLRGALSRARIQVCQTLFRPLCCSRTHRMGGTQRSQVKIRLSPQRATLGNPYYSGVLRCAAHLPHHVVGTARARQLALEGGGVPRPGLGRGGQLGGRESVQGEATPSSSHARTETSQPLLRRAVSKLWRTSGVHFRPQRIDRNGFGPFNSLATKNPRSIPLRISSHAPRGCVS